MSTRTMTGVVSKISEKDWYDRKAGENITLYSFALDGEKGWFRTGTTRPPMNEGDYVRFVVDTTKGNVELESIEQVEGTAPTRAPRASDNSGRRFPPKKGGSGGTASQRDDYWKDKEKYYKEVEVPRITFSACQSRAIEVVKLALGNDALSLGTKKSERLENLLAVVDEVTERFVEQINSLDGNLPKRKKATREPGSDDEPFDDEIPFGNNDDEGWDD